MKIKTNRMWNLNLEHDGDDCIDIYEKHIGSDGEPRIVVPVEAIDEVVLFLLKAKKKIEKNQK